MNTRVLDVVDLGHRGYLEVLDLQRAMRLARIDGSLPNDTLLLVEHDPVFTLGRSTVNTSLPLSPDDLRQRGAEVVEIERGGDVTWHGPGQLVGYAILDLRQHREDLHWYLRQLEQVQVDALDALGIDAERNPGKTGVWTKGRKIASIGVHVKQWITLHGFALNVHPDLSWFDLIVPCGINGVEMTSVGRELHSTDANTALWAKTCEEIVRAFGASFDLEPRHTSIPEGFSRRSLANNGFEA